jgi:hypothetical protein
MHNEHRPATPESNCGRFGNRASGSGRALMAALTHGVMRFEAIERALEIDPRQSRQHENDRRANQETR